MACIATTSQGCAAHSRRIQKTGEIVMFTLVSMPYMVACGLVHVKQEVLIGMIHLVFVVLFSHSVLLA